MALAVLGAPLRWGRCNLPTAVEVVVPDRVTPPEGAGAVAGFAQPEPVAQGLRAAVAAVAVAALAAVTEMDRKELVLMAQQGAAAESMAQSEGKVFMDSAFQVLEARRAAV